MAMSLRTLLIAGVALAAVGGGSLALAQDAGIGGVAFGDPNAEQLPERERIISVDVSMDGAVRFAPLAPTPESEGARQLELEFAATGEQAGVPFDVSVSRRASLGADDNGDIDRQGFGSEVRIGRGLVQRDSNDGGEQSSVYMFVASDDEALTWRPGQRSEFGGRGSSFSLQDQVEVGDVSAGVTYERNGVQASLAYVEREVSAQVGRDSYSTEENFTGVTVTMRR